MNFFARQANARRNARRLIWLFILAVIVVVFAVDTIVMVAFSALAGHRNELSGSFADSMAAPSLWVLTSLIVLAVILLSSAYRSSQVSAGAMPVAVQVRAVPS